MPEGRDPLRDLFSLQDRMSRLFEESLRSGAREKPSRDGAVSWSPVVDIYQTDRELVLLVEIPGVERENIDVGVENGSLTIRGERTLPAGVQGRQFHVSERRYGGFQRSFALPAGIDPEGIQANFKQGVLEIRMVRKESQKVRRVEVR